MLIQIKRADAIAQYKSLPHRSLRPYFFFFPKTYRVDTFTLSSRSARGHATLLANALTSFAKLMQSDELLFLGCGTTPWLYQEAKHKAAIRAVCFLTDNKINKRFNGAIVLKLPEQKEFIKHLFWLTRCHGSFPEVYFMDKQQQFVGNICRYGNIHLYLTEKTQEEQYLKAAAAAGFEFLETFPCTERFGSNRARQLVV
jgi:hypothetical protein